MKFKSFSCIFNKAKPFLAVIFLQFGFAGMVILLKVALNHGMSNYVLVVYRHAIATFVTAPFAFFLEKKVRPRMTMSLLIKIVALSLLEPVIDQNLYYMGIKYTSATFAATMVNILPAMTFLLAWIFRLEKVKLTSMYSQMKIVGTIATVGGAMLMTLVKGPAFELFSPKSHSTHQLKKIDISLHDAIKGSFMMFVGCFCLASFMILQAITLKEYPAELSLTAWICLLGSIEGTALALVMEKGNYSVWSLSWDSKLLASLYGGVLCSGLAYYIQGIIMKKRGPVFVTAFNPLSMVIVAILSSLILAENMYLGRVVGAAVIIGGLYLVIWGKSKDYEPTPTEADQEKAISKEQYEDEAMDATNSKHEQFQSQNA